MTKPTPTAASAKPSATASSAANLEKADLAEDLEHEIPPNAKTEPQMFISVPVSDIVRWRRKVEARKMASPPADHTATLVARIEDLRLQAQTLADDIRADLENSLREHKFKSEREMEGALEGDAVYNQVTAEERAYSRVLALLKPPTAAEAEK